MTLSEKARTVAQRSKPGPQCGVAKLRARVKPRLRGELDEFLADRSFGPSTMRSTLVEEAGRLGVDPADIPGAYTLGKHRRGECRCDAQ